MKQHFSEKKRKITNLHAYVSENPRHMEVIFNQSGAKLRLQDGGTHESVTMLENSIKEDLGSISMAPKMSCNSSNSILTGSCGPRLSWWSLTTGRLYQSIMG